MQKSLLDCELLRPLQQEKVNTSRWQRERKSEIESGRITTPTSQSVSRCHPTYSCKGTAHCMQAHTLRPHRCSSASETRKSDCPPFHWVRGQKKTRVWINSLPIYGLQEVLRLHSSKKCILSSFFSHYTAEYCEGISTGWTDMRIGNPDMGMEWSSCLIVLIV